MIASFLCFIESFEVHVIATCGLAVIGWLLLGYVGARLGRLLSIPWTFWWWMFCGALCGWVMTGHIATLGEMWQRTHMDVSWAVEIRRHFGAASVTFAAMVLTRVLRRVFWETWFTRQTQAPAPKFLVQIAELGFLMAVLYFVALIGYGRESTGLAISSSVAVGVLGFAMQDLLGNLLAGIALQVSKPFKQGDWLVVEGKQAEVVEINWRSTRLRDTDDVHFDIPNKTLVTSTITNLTYPTSRHGVRIQIGFEYGSPPNAVKDALLRAANVSFGVLPEPPPNIFVKDYAESAITYEIRIWIDQPSRYSDILDSLRTNVWYEAKRAGLNIPFPIRTLIRSKPEATPDRVGDRQRIIARQPVLQTLGHERVSALLQAAPVLRFGRGERIINQGDSGDSMFILINGQAEVLVKNPAGSETTVASLQTGDCIGEMSLLTGEPRSASVVALTDCELWQVAKNDISPLLHDHPELAERLGELLTRRRLETDDLLKNLPATEAAKRAGEYKRGLLDKLSTFFRL